MDEAEKIAEKAADEASHKEDNPGLAYYTANLVVKRLREAGLLRGE